MHRFIYDWPGASGSQGYYDPNGWIYIEVWEDDSWPDGDDLVVSATGWEQMVYYYNPSFPDRFYMVPQQWKNDPGEAGIMIANENRGTL